MENIEKITKRYLSLKLILHSSYGTFGGDNTSNKTKKAQELWDEYYKLGRMISDYNNNEKVPSSSDSKSKDSDDELVALTIQLMNYTPNKFGEY